MMTSNLRTSALVSLLVLLLAALAACGGDDDGDGPLLPGFNDDSNGGSGDDNGNGDDDGDDDDTGLPTFGSGGTARLTLGDETFEPILANRVVAGTGQLGFCRVIFGALQVFGYADTDDGRIVQVEMWIPPTNWESFDDERYDPPRVEIEIEDPNGDGGGSWVADQERYDEDSQVDDYDMDGRHATGTMTLRKQFFDDLPPVQGTFDVECEE